MPAPTRDGREVIGRMADAVDQVQQRLLRATTALQVAGVAYAVVGGNAVAAWVSTINRAAVRFTQDVDILVKREDLPRVRHALELAGFFYRHAAGLDMFMDSPKGNPRDAVHLVFADERVKDDQPLPNPGIDESERLTFFSVVTLDALVRLKLSAFRRKDQVHLLDMLGVGLIDPSWVAKLPPVLAARLQTLIDTPDG